MIRGVEGIHVRIVATLIEGVIIPLYIVEFSTIDSNVRSALEKRRHESITGVE